MDETYKSMRLIGKQVGATSHKVEKWLTALGLRVNGSPTTKAFEGDFVTRSESTQPGTYFYIWHVEKTVKALVDGGYLVRVPPKADPSA